MPRSSGSASPTAELSELIGLIYDATLRPETWPAALEAVCEYVGGNAANLFSHDEGPEGVRLFHSIGENPDYTSSYVTTYRHLNPYFPAALLAPEGQVMVGADLMPHLEFRRTRFYLEWVQPQGYVDMLGVSLVRHKGGSVFLSVRRGEQHGLADARAVRRLRLVASHIRRAVLIGQVLEVCRRDIVSLEQMMNSMATAIFLVDANASIVNANAEGRRLIDEGNVVCQLDGRLRPTHSRMHDLFAKAIARSAGQALSEGQVVPLECRGDHHRSRWYAHVVTFRGSRSMADHRVTTVLVRDAALGFEAPIGIMQQLYHLTDAQARVLGAVIDLGGSAGEIARTLNLSINTVRTHLRELFSKTGTTRQAGLVRLAAAHMPSIALEPG